MREENIRPRGKEEGAEEKKRPMRKRSKGDSEEEEKLKIDMGSRDRLEQVLHIGKM